MAQTSYKVQKGDTRSGIAQKLGVKLDEVGLGRSGKGDLIYEGETLNVGPKTEAQTYANDVKSGLADEVGGTQKPGKASDLYDLETIRTDRTTAKTGLDTAFKKYQSSLNEAFDDEYEKRKLSKKKDRIAELDADIAEKKSIRDKDVSEVRANSGLSAASMTGDIAKLRDAHNAEINNLVSERNGLASEYNSELGEVESAAGRRAAADKAEYDYYAGLYNSAGGLLKDYQSTLADELRADTQADQFDRQLAQALTIAQMRGSGDNSPARQLVRDDDGMPLYWYDSDGNIFPIDGADSPESSNTGIDWDDTEEEVQQAGGTGTKGTWWNPFSWSNYFD